MKPTPPLSYLRCFFLCILLWNSKEAKFQNHKIDSLEQVLKTLPEDSNRILMLNDLCNLYLTTDVEKSISYGREAKSLCKRTQNVFLLPTVENCLGNAYSEAGQSDSAISCFIISREGYEKSDRRLKSAGPINNLSATYKKIGKYDLALQYLINALKIHEEFDNKKGICSTSNGIGLLFLDLGKFEEARTYFEQALKISRLLNLVNYSASVESNLGLCCEKEGNYEGALKYYEQSLLYFEKTNNKYGKGILYENMGGIYSALKQFKQGIELLLKGYKMKEDVGDIEGMVRNLKNIAGAYYDSGDREEKALYYFLKSLELARKFDLKPLLKEIYLSLATYYAKRNNYQEAYRQYVLFSEIKDTLLNQENNKQMAEMQTKYGTEKKEQEIRFLNQDKERRAAISNSESKRKNFIIGSVAITLLLVLLFSIFLYYRFRITQRQKRIIEKQKVLVEQKREEAEHQKELAEEKQKEILDSIHYAKRIQQAVITSEAYISSFVKEYFILFQPKDIVAGDFYWALSPPPLTLTIVRNKVGEESGNRNCFYIIAADCTGHGVPGAFMSLLNISILNEIVIEKELRSPDLILNEARNSIIKALNPTGKEDVQDGMDCILCAFDFDNLRISYAAANNSFYIARGDTLITCPADKMPVGKSPRDHLAFTLQEMDLQSQDVVYILTDGYADQFGGSKGKKFKYKQLEEILLSISHLPMQEQAGVLKTKFNQWKGGLEQVDDVTVIGIRM